MAGARYAGFWRRVAAALIDAILLLTLMLFALVSWISVTGEAHAWDSTTMAMAFYGSLLAALATKILLDAWLGGTPGLHLMDCCLADSRGAASTLDSTRTASPFRTVSTRTKGLWSMSWR